MFKFNGGKNAIVCVDCWVIIAESVPVTGQCLGRHLCPKCSLNLIMVCDDCLGTGNLVGPCITCGGSGFKSGHD